MHYAVMLNPGDDPWLALFEGRLSSEQVTRDDLQRISGIGKYIEKELNKCGYFTYAQIAAWPEEEIQKISRELSLYKRIQRENWVRQAKILTNGGLTPFARNVDRRAAKLSPAYGSLSRAVLAATDAANRIAESRQKT